MRATHFEVAKQAHLDWLGYAQRMVASHTISESIPLNDTECKFGKLLHEEGLLQAIKPDIVEDVDLAHHMLHDMYKNIYDLYKTSEINEDTKNRAVSYLESLEEVSESMLELLDEAKEGM